MPRAKHGWEDAQPDYFNIINILGIPFVFITAYISCATWFPFFSPPLFYSALLLFFILLSFCFLKLPAATFIVSLALCVAVVAHPHPLLPTSSSPQESYNNININNNNNKNNGDNNISPTYKETYKEPEKETEKENKYMPPQEENKFTPPAEYRKYKPPKEVIKGIC